MYSEMYSIVCYNIRVFVPAYHFFYVEVLQQGDTLLITSMNRVYKHRYIIVYNKIPLGVMQFLVCSDSIYSNTICGLITQFLIK